jgi:hypothetical protein
MFTMYFYLEPQVPPNKKLFVEKIVLTFGVDSFEYST